MRHTLFFAALLCLFSLGAEPPPPPQENVVVQEEILDTPVPPQTLDAVIVFPAQQAQREALVKFLQPPSEEPKLTATAPQAVAAWVANLLRETTEELSKALSVVHEGVHRLPLLPWDAIVVELGALLLLALWMGTLQGSLRLLLRFYLAKQRTRPSAVQHATSVIEGARVVGGALLLLLTTVLTVLGGWAGVAWSRGWLPQPQEAYALLIAAFWVVESARTLLHLLFGLPASGMRLLGIVDYEATYWGKQLSRLLSFAGYGLLFGAPYLANEVDPLAGAAVALFTIVCTALYAMITVLRSRHRVSALCLRHARTATSLLSQVFWQIGASLWYWLALGYIFLFLSGGVVAPYHVLRWFTAGTILSLGSLLLAHWLLKWWRKRSSWLLEHACTMQKRYPHVSRSICHFVPIASVVWQLVIGIGALVLILQAWQRINVLDWLRSEAGVRALSEVVSVLFSFGAAAALWLGIEVWLDYLTAAHERKRSAARTETLLGLLRNFAAVLLWIALGLVILSAFGVNVGPLLAGAGVAGLAIGIGAQKVILDVLNGILIQFDDAIHEGDVVRVADITGKVERMTIRAISIRDLKGVFHVIPFSSVTTVSNFTKDYSCFVGEYCVAYQENTDQACAALRAAFKELATDPAITDDLLGELDIHGVTALAESSVKIRISIRTSPGAQWAVERAFNRLVKKRFDADGIVIPFPQLTVWQGSLRQ